MVKAYGMISSQGLAGLLIIDDDGNKYLNAHTIAYSNDTLATIAHFVDAGGGIRDKALKPNLVYLTEPRPIPEHVKKIFAIAYNNLGLHPLFVANSDCAYTKN